jgi:hypothetical protein
LNLLTKKRDADEEWSNNNKIPQPCLETRFYHYFYSFFMKAAKKKMFMPYLMYWASRNDALLK